MRDKVNKFRLRGATVEYVPGSDKANVRLEGKMLFMPIELVEKSLHEITMNATLDCLTATDKLMLEVFKDSNIV